MKQIYYILIIMLVGSAKVVLAQNRPLQKIKEAKIEILKTTLNLSAEQEKTFWPLFNDFEEVRGNLRKQIRENSLKINTLTATDEQIQANLKEILNLRQKEIDLEKDYFNKFLKVINIRQLAELHKTEQKFTQLLLGKLNKKERD